MEGNIIITREAYQNSGRGILDLREENIQAVVGEHCMYENIQVVVGKDQIYEKLR